jgi:hypothetical protein
MLYMSCGIPYGIPCGSQSRIHMSKFKGDIKEALKSVKVVTAGRCLRSSVVTLQHVLYNYCFRLHYPTSCVLYYAVYSSHRREMRLIASSWPSVRVPC